MWWVSETAPSPPTNEAPPVGMVDCTTWRTRSRTSPSANITLRHAGAPRLAPPDPRWAGAHRHPRGSIPRRSPDGRGPGEEQPDASWPLDSPKCQIPARREREWFVLAAIPADSQQQIPSLVIARNHGAAAAWIEQHGLADRTGDPRRYAKRRRGPRSLARHCRRSTATRTAGTCSWIRPGRHRCSCRSASTHSPVQPASASHQATPGTQTSPTGSPLSWFRLGGPSTTRA